MKKIKEFSLILCLIMIFCGCYKNSNNSSSSYIAKEDSSKIHMYGGANYSDGTSVISFEERYDKIKKDYPDKTILIWLCDDEIGRYESELNSYLNKNNYDYVICTKNIIDDSELFDDEYNIKNSDSKILENAFSDDNQIDIISTGNYNCNFFNNNQYYFFVNNDWLEPIDNYLLNTDSGKKLYDIFPVKYWNTLKYNNKIYGIDGSLKCLNKVAGYKVNANLVDDLNIDLNDFNGDYLTSLNNIFKKCKENKLKFSAGLLNYMTLYNDYDFINENVYINNNGKACNIYETNDVKQIFNKIQSAFLSNIDINLFIEEDDSSNINENSNANNQGIENLNQYLGESFLCTGGIHNGIRTNEFYGLTSSKGEAVESYQIFPRETKILHSTNQVTGIYSKSKNKDMAFDALATIMTDKKINTMLCYGDDYEIIDNQIKPNGYYNTYMVENKMISYPFYQYESANTQSHFKKVINNADLSKNIGFYFDGKKVSNQLVKMENIINKLIKQKYHK